MNLTWLEQAAQLTIVLGFCGAAFNYIVMHPLNESLKRLSNILAEIRADLNKDKERIHLLEGKVQELAHALQKAHDRIDEFLRKEAAHYDSA